MKGRDGKQIQFKMLLELPMSEVFAGGRRREGRESTEGKREVEWWENKVKSSPQTLSKWEKGVQSWRGGGRKGGKKIGTTQCYQGYLLKGKGHDITQGRQG